jgi:hypothetical protein
MLLSSVTLVALAVPTAILYRMAADSTHAPPAAAVKTVAASPSPTPPATTAISPDVDGPARLQRHKRHRVKPPLPGVLDWAGPRAEAVKLRVSCAWPGGLLGTAALVVAHYLVANHVGACAPADADHADADHAGSYPHGLGCEPHAFGLTTVPGLAAVPSLAMVPSLATVPVAPDGRNAGGEPECYAGLCRRRCLGCSAAATGGTPRDERAKERRDG